MIRSTLLWSGVGIFALLSVACGKPKPEPLVPVEVTDFQALYVNNCSGCHGTSGMHGAAQSLNNAVYLALVPKETLRQVIANGVPGSLMPGFSTASGGDFSANQINILTEGIEKWANPSAVQMGGLPPYTSTSRGDATAGAQTFQAACASCHGKDGKGGSLSDGSFLELATDQSLRTATIAGRPDQGMPDWRNDLPQHPLSDAEIDNVVAYISSQRTGPESPDQPSGPDGSPGGNN